MFDLIKFVIEKVILAIPWKAIKESKNKKQLNEIGAQLFLFYMALNRIVSNGDAIIREIESIFDWLDRKEREGKIKEEIVLSDLYYQLVAQGTSIVDLSSSAGRLAASLELVAPGPYSEIFPLIRGKATALQEISVALSGGPSIWVGRSRPQPTLEHVRVTAREDIRGVRETINMADLSREVDAAFDLSVTLRAERGVLKREQLVLLRNFYDTSARREQLDILRKNASDLRKEIIANFSVQDLLLYVGDRSLVSGAPFNVLG